MMNWWRCFGTSYVRRRRRKMALPAVFRLTLCLLFLLWLLWLRPSAFYFFSGTAPKHEIRQECNFDALPELPNIIFYRDNKESHRNRAAEGDPRVTHVSGNGNEQACRVPKTGIFRGDDEVFDEIADPLNCEMNEENWAYVDSERKFQISESAQKKYSNIQCSLSSIYRVKDKIRTWKPVRVKPGDLINRSDFALVNCTTDSKSKKWSQLLWTILPDDSRIKQLSAIKREQDWSGLDVYFIGFSSVSQMAFRRYLPETVKFLEDELQSVVLNGYNVVGNGKLEAFMPILTGFAEEELPPTRLEFPNASYVDDVYPFVWKNFSDAGYATLFAEDLATFGMFNYRRKHFRQQPTDHHPRPFFRKLELLYIKTKLLCAGSAPLHKDWFRYMSEFMARYPGNIPKFLLAFYDRLSHSHVSQIRAADVDTANHLRALQLKGLLDKAVVIAMADHGHQLIDHQGQLEVERRPFFSISLPKRFRESQRGKLAFENLQRNKDRLTTPFDIHATLMDILHWPSDQLLSTPNEIASRSMSLFREVPLARTCAHAGIPAHFCACLQRQSAMRSTSQHRLSVQLARAVVRTINDYTEKERSLCSQIELFFVEDAHELLSKEAMAYRRQTRRKDASVANFIANKASGFSYYRLKFWTAPGDSLYEATVKYEPSKDTVTVELGSISHVNAYGNVSHCINLKNHFMSPYCVCYD